MYYEYPLLENAYKGDANGNFGQYFFGPDMFISPVTKPALMNSSMSVSTIWIPPGTWYEKTTGVLLTGASDGSTILTKSFDITEIPVFIRSGAIIPKIPLPPGNTLGLARRQYTTLILEIYPGQNSGSLKLYEDDGISVDYLSNKFTWTQVTYTLSSWTLQVVISPASGSFPGFPTTRNYILNIISTPPIVSGTVNGNALSYSRFDIPNSWKYDGESMMTIITTDFLPTANSITAVLNFPPNNWNLSGYRGAIQKAKLSKRNLDPDWGTPGSNSITGGYLSRLASTGFELSFLAGTNMNAVYSIITTLPALYANATTEIQNLKPTLTDDPTYFPLTQYWSSDRNDNLLCGSTDCQSANNQLYVVTRTEGYQPRQGSPGTIPLYDYWYPTIQDNYATSLSTPPSDYSPATFKNGFIYANHVDGTSAVSVWWNKQRGDMLTTASVDGFKYAMQFNYTLINSTIGYVYLNPPDHQSLVPLSRWAYSIELLYNALN
jgi:hypothetical protein